MWGFADLHCHPMSHLGFGGRLFWGSPDDPGGMGAALAHCEPAHGLGGTGIGGGVANVALTKFEDPGFGGGIGHLTGGAPEFDGWPRFFTTIHQQMYVDWIRRAFDGGLRLMVALAVNNQFLARELGGQPPYDDVTVVEAQLRATSDFVARHGEWMGVARSPEEARQLIGDGKLAVVLGVEVDSLGNWRRPSDCSDEDVTAYLEHLYRDLGVRHLFPVHLANNAFGGAAVYDDRFALLNRALNDDYIDIVDGSDSGIEFRLEVDPGLAVDWYKSPINLADPWGGAYYRPPRSYTETPGGHANALGLTERGRAALGEMMRLGMVIDVDHLSQRALHETLELAESRGYPVVSGHTSFRELAWRWRGGDGETSSVHKCPSETQKTAADVERIRALGGMVAPILAQGDIRDVRSVDPTVGSAPANDCAGSSRSWAQAYLYAVAKMGGRGVGLGTDGNGLAKLPGPRFGPNAAYHLDNGVTSDRRRRPRRQAQVDAQANGVRYDSPPVDWRRYRWAEGATAEHLHSDRQRDMWHAVGVVRSGADPWADRDAHGGPLRGISERVRNLAKGLTAHADEQLLRPGFLGIGTGDAPEEQRAGFLVGSGQAPGSSERDPPLVHELHGELLRIWRHASAMDGANAPIGRSIAGRRDFDINIDGVAHYGMLADFVTDLRNVGLSDADLAPLFRSAEDYIELWERCRSGGAGGRREATTLRLVAVAAPDINRIFTGEESVTVEDSTAAFATESAAGFVQSRTFPRGTTPATTGLQAYLYRIVVERAGDRAGAGLTSLTVPFGPVAEVDYDGTGPSGSFVVTAGALGAVGPATAEVTGDAITFAFAPPGLHGVESSYFFGLCSQRPPAAVAAVLGDGPGRSHHVAVRAPAPA